MSEHRSFQSERKLSDIRMPPFNTFTPLLIPPPARAKVLIPVRFLRRFIHVFYSISIVVVFIFGIILGTVPSKALHLNMLVQGLLSIVFIASFISIVFSLNMKRIYSVHQLNTLERFCNGDVTAATPLAMDVASDSSNATLSTAVALMDHSDSLVVDPSLSNEKVTEEGKESQETNIEEAEKVVDNLDDTEEHPRSFPANILTSKTPALDPRGCHYYEDWSNSGSRNLNSALAKTKNLLVVGSSDNTLQSSLEEITECFQRNPSVEEMDNVQLGDKNVESQVRNETIIAIEDETTPIISGYGEEYMKEKELICEFRAAAAEGTMIFIEKEMEKESLFIVRRTIDFVLKSIRSVAVLLPTSSFFAGYVLCKLGVEINGVELIFTGFLMALVMPLVWHRLNDSMAEKFSDAEKEVIFWERKAHEEQKKKELEEIQKKIREAELQQKIVVELAREKESEIEEIREARRAEESRKVSKGERLKIFGFSLPEF